MASGEAFRADLADMAVIHRKMGLWPGMTYAGRDDFVARHGVAFAWRPLPAGVRLGAPKRCFANAFSLYLKDTRRWTYVEGYVLRVIPIHHAWLEDQDHPGIAVDVTLRVVDPEHPVYLGVRFPTDVLWPATQVSETMGGILDDWQHQHPLFKEPYDTADTDPTARRLWAIVAERAEKQRAARRNGKKAARA